MLPWIDHLQTIGFTDCVAGALNAWASVMSRTDVLGGKFGLQMLALPAEVGLWIDVHLAESRYLGLVQSIALAAAVSP
jgi:hypothetical protein